MSTAESILSTKLLCAACKTLMNEPRMSRCGHSFCTSCLESMLQTRQEFVTLEAPSSISSSMKKGFRFQCPLAECEKKEYLVPTLCVDQFPINLTLKQLIEDWKLKENESVCQQHRRVTEWFCLDCSREICKSCLKEHKLHDFLEKDEAIKIYIGQCKKRKDVSDLKISEAQTQFIKCDAVLESAEEIIIGNFERAFETFEWTRVTVENEEINCITKCLQDIEFKVPLRNRRLLFQSIAPLHQIGRMVAPLLKNPGKKVMEPVHVHQLAELTLYKFEANIARTQMQFKMKSPLLGSRGICVDFQCAIREKMKGLKFLKYCTCSFFKCSPDCNL